LQPQTKDYMEILSSIEPIVITGSVVVYQEAGTWFAHCLEYDIVAQGKTEESVKSSFEKMFVGQIMLDLIQKKRPLQDCFKAPKEIWDMVKEPKTHNTKPIYVPNEGVSATLVEYKLAA
jgi:hypothetical protein